MSLRQRNVGVDEKEAEPVPILDEDEQDAVIAELVEENEKMNRRFRFVFTAIAVALGVTW